MRLLLLSLSFLLLQVGFAQKPTEDGFEVFSIDGEKLYLQPTFPLPSAYHINHNFMLFQMPGAGNSLVSIEGIKDSMQAWSVKSMAITNINGDTLSKYKLDSLGRFTHVTCYDSTHKAFYCNTGFTGYRLFGYTKASTGRDSIITLEMVDNKLGPMHLVRYDTINGRKVKMEYKPVMGEGYRLADETQYWFDSKDRITEEMTIRKSDTLAYKRTWYNNSNEIVADSGFVRVPKSPASDYVYTNKYDNGLIKYAFIHYPLNQGSYGQGGRPSETKYFYNIKTTAKETKGTVIVEDIDVLSKGITKTTTTTWLRKSSSLDSTIHIKHRYGEDKTIYRLENKPGYTKSELTKMKYTKEGKLTEKNYTMNEYDSSLAQLTITEKDFTYQDGKEELWRDRTRKTISVGDWLENWVLTDDSFRLSNAVLYNSNGKIIRSKEYKGNNISEDRTEYDSLGRVRSESKWLNGEKTAEAIHTYENNHSTFNHPVSRRNYNNGDYNGNIIEYKNSIRYRTIQFTGKIIGNDTTYKYKQETLFNEWGDSLLYTYQIDSNVITVAQFEYNSKRQVLRAKYVNGETNYAYDKNGSLLSKTWKTSNTHGPMPLKITFQNSCFWGELIPAQFGRYTNFTFDVVNCEKDESIYTRNNLGQLVSKKRCLTQKDGAFFCMEDSIEYRDSIIVLRKYIAKSLVETRFYQFNNKGFLSLEMLETYCINDHKGDWVEVNLVYLFDENGMLIYHELPSITRAGEVMSIEYRAE